MRAFAHFGGVPKRITFDNTTLAVAKVGKGRERKFTHEFSRLVSHHLFETHFCRVRMANEKGNVEPVQRTGEKAELCGAAGASAPIKGDAKRSQETRRVRPPQLSGARAARAQL